jgi:hypothetical protein
MLLCILCTAQIGPTKRGLHLSTAQAQPHSLAKPREGDGRRLGGGFKRLRRGDRGGRRRAGAAAGRRGGCTAARLRRGPPDVGGRRAQAWRRGGVLPSPAAEVGLALGVFRLIRFLVSWCYLNGSFSIFPFTGIVLPQVCSHLLIPIDVRSFNLQVCDLWLVRSAMWFDFLCEL